MPEDLFNPKNQYCMKNFTSAVKSTDTLSAREMKNVKGGGNCGFQFVGASGQGGRIVCDLEESDYSQYENISGRWCCKNCDEIGC